MISLHALSLVNQTYRYTRFEAFQDSLKGNGKTLMLVNVAPGEDNASESLCSLQFATRVRGIELGPLKRNVESGVELKELRDEVQRLKAEVKPSQYSAHCILQSQDITRKSALLDAWYLSHIQKL